MHYQRDLMGEVIDYTLCGYLGEMVICHNKCDDCNDDDKILNRAHFNQKYEDEGKVLFSSKNTRKKRKI